MKSLWKRAFSLFPAALILSFVLLFFGYLRPEFDMVFHVDNIEGEGIAEAYVCPPLTFSPFYKVGFYFGSELKKATVKGIHYDVKVLNITVSGASAAEFDSFDLIYKGFRLGHFEVENRFTPRDYGYMSISLSEDGDSVHFDFADPDQGTTISFNTHFAPWWFWLCYAVIVLAVAVLLAFLFGYLAGHLPALSRFLDMAAAIALALLAGCFFCGSLPYLEYRYFLLNWLFLFAAALAINALTLPYLGTVLTMVFTLGWYIANYFVITFRNKPIMPADLKAVGTAAEVMGSYSFRPTWQMILGAVIVLCCAAAVVLRWKKGCPKEKQPLKRSLTRRGIALVTAAVLVALGVNTPAFKQLNTFAWDAVLLKSFHAEGMVLTYLKGALTSGVKKPEGYSRELVDGFLAEYSADHEKSGPQPTRIIMVMNEAFSDLRTVGLDERIDVMPFIDSLEENTLEGNLSVSVFGGGTCNTEFEALTGNTLAFLGTGAYPYTENVTEPRFSLASYFRGLGYGTEAFHANEAHNWNRNRVYPNLGFSAFHSIPDYHEALDSVQMLHDLPADTADYAYMEKVDEGYGGKPRFLFNVTMQNHSGYEHWEDVGRVPSVEEYGADLYLDGQIYLSLVYASDQAVKQLVETYRDSDEPTMIIFFGDHQPGLPVFAQREIYTKMSSYLDWYKSEFFIWTNYDTEEARDVAVSANYLPWLILERGNFPLPPFVQLLREVHEKYPVISAMGVVDAEGNIYGSVNDLLDDPLIRKYQYVQYANLFDEIDQAWFEVN